LKEEERLRTESKFITLGDRGMEKLTGIIAEESARFVDPESVADRFDELVDSVESLDMNVDPESDGRIV
jgi:hypothetical protein